jgi:hypothetical protein
MEVIKGSPMFRDRVIQMHNDTGLGLLACLARIRKQDKLDLTPKGERCSLCGREGRDECESDQASQITIEHDFKPASTPEEERCLTCLSPLADHAPGDLVRCKPVPAPLPSGELTAPCGHEPPQSASQLHGVCIFCWRNRAAALRAEVERLKKANATFHRRLTHWKAKAKEGKK